jgi:hypothetical protein
MVIVVDAVEILLIGAVILVIVLLTRQFVEKIVYTNRRLILRIFVVTIRLGDYELWKTK